MITNSSNLPVSSAIFFQLSCSFFLTILISFPVSSSSLYKWIDENGEVRYSDNLPSDQTKKGFQTITPDGRVLTIKEKAKPPQQIREERAAKKRLAEESRIQAEVNARLSAMQEHHDNVLLMTFTNENEILEAENERLAVIDSVIQLLKKNVITEQEKLKVEEDRAKRLYRDKNIPVPGGQAQKIEYFTDKVLSKQQHLSQKIAERKKVKQQYVKDLIRYRELIKIAKRRELAEEEEKARLKEESLYYD